MAEAQKWLNENYPKDKKKEIEVVFGRSRDLEGELVIEDFPKLEKT